MEARGEALGAARRAVHRRDAPGVAVRARVAAPAQRASCAPRSSSCTRPRSSRCMPLVAKQPGRRRAASTRCSSRAWASARSSRRRNCRACAERWNRDQIAVGGSILHAVGDGVRRASRPNTWVAAPAMFVGRHGMDRGRELGDVAAQLALPDWVRARGMSIYQMAIMGGSALGAVDLGASSPTTRPCPTSLAIASVSMLVDARPHARPHARGRRGPHADASLRRARARAAVRPRRRAR